VTGAIVWWNLYFLQLIPSVRRSYNKKLHRWLGRLLMVAALLQTISGVGLACTSHSAIIKIVSLVFAIAVTYCLAYAWYYAWRRDIPRHKYWVLRLVGYLQTIAAQRFWFLIVILLQASGNTFLYPAFNDDDKEMINRTVMEMFDGSFVLAILTATYITEWYLSGSVGMLETPSSIMAEVTTSLTDAKGSISEGGQQGGNHYRYQTIADHQQ